MDTIEKAKELAMAIAQDDVIVRLQKAKAANEADLPLQEMIGKFNLKKMSLSGEYKKVPIDEEKTKKLEQELRDMYADIMRNEHMTEFAAAKEAMDALIGQINDIIRVAVDGELDPGGCSGHCEGCTACR
jgi:cell fate (sporulation/competence/biofilm development) regulator YlbF (YheA/YmcA/DUF963 family)